MAADLPNLPQNDLRIRIIPYNPNTLSPGISSDSQVFGSGSNNLPQITALSTPTGSLGGWISFQYTVADPDGDYVGIEGEYSLNGGTSYQTATLGQGDGNAAVSAPSTGISHNISWHAQGDAPNIT